MYFIALVNLSLLLTFNCDWHFSGDIEQCELLANIVSKNLVSIGASLAHVHVPGHEANINDGLGLNEIEVGMGIHNEQGSARMEVPSLPNLIKLLLDQLLNKDNKDRAYLDWSQDANFVLLVNNLGGVSPLELGGITAEVLAQLGETYGIRPLRVFSGTFMTSLNGLGFSVTLLKLVDFSGFSILELLDAPAKVCAWPNNLPSLPGPDELEFKPGAGVAEELDLEVPSGLRSKIYQAHLGYATLISRRQLTWIDSALSSQEVSRS